MDQIVKIPELFGTVTANLNGETLSKMCHTSEGIHKVCESSEIWLNNLESRFGISLNNVTAYSTLLKFAERHIIKNMDVVLVDWKAKDNPVKLLGQLLVTSVDTVAEVLHRLDVEFGLLGNVAISSVNKTIFTRKRYHHFSEYSYYTDIFGADAAAPIISTKILHHKESMELKWFTTPISLLYSQGFIGDIEIVFLKRNYSKKQLNNIRRLINKALKPQN